MLLSADQTVEALRAAGEPTRLRVLSLLAGEELSVMELSRILEQSQPRVSRHLKLMTDAGLIERFPDGARVFYRLSSDPLARRLVGQGIRAGRPRGAWGRAARRPWRGSGNCGHWGTTGSRSSSS